MSNNEPRETDGEEEPPMVAAPEESPLPEDSVEAPVEDPTEEQDEIALEVEVEPPEPTPEERIAVLEQEKKDLHDKYLRQVAEVENVRKRGRRDAQDNRLEAQSKVLREVLPVLDNLERAVAHAESGGDGSGVLEGVQLVLRQFTQAFERLEVFKVDAEGTPFDPNKHEAVAQIETADAPAGQVVSVMQNGYMIGERLLRPAMVAVAKAPPAPPEPPGPNGHDTEAEGSTPAVDTDADASDGDSGDES